MKSLKPLCEHYFNLFINKDINGLSTLFSDDIKLIDWNISTKGKNEVLLQNKNIFDNVNDIKIEINELIEEHNKVCCQINLSIKVDEKYENINIVDIITFDDLMKIKKIEAYKI